MPSDSSEPRRSRSSAACPTSPGILTAIRLTPDLGVHLRGLADELLVNDFPGATISRAEREMLATAVSAANDCFFCMDSHAAHADALLERSGEIELVPAPRHDQGRVVGGLDAKMRALLHISRTVRRAPLDLTADDVAVAQAAGATDARCPARGAHRRRVLDVQPDRRRVPRPDRTGHRRLPRARRPDRRARLHPAGHLGREVGREGPKAKLRRSAPCRRGPGRDRHARRPRRWRSTTW